MASLTSRTLFLMLWQLIINTLILVLLNFLLAYIYCAPMVQVPVSIGIYLQWMIQWLTVKLLASLNFSLFLIFSLGLAGPLSPASFPGTGDPYKKNHTQLCTKNTSKNIVHNFFAQYFVHKIMHNIMHNCAPLCTTVHLYAQLCTFMHNYSAFLSSAIYNKNIYEIWNYMHMYN